MKRGEAIQWMGGLVRISTGKAIQWRGPGDSVNCRTLKSETLLSSSSSRKSTLRDAVVSSRGKFRKSRKKFGRCQNNHPAEVRCEIVLCFSLPKVSWNLAWNFGEIFCVPRFQSLGVRNGKFHEIALTKTAWKTENFTQISLCWGGGTERYLPESRKASNSWISSS